jgi:predicted metal-dependent phosphoesterase TrpH
MQADLHSHSTASDGRLSPTALVDLALAAGVTHLALTDHDTIAGFTEASVAAQGRLVVIPGLEVTADWSGREVHVLALFVQPGAPALVAFVERARQERATRIERMVAALRHAKIDVTLDDVLAEANGAVLARPHLARALVSRGYVESTQRAFDRLLGPGCPGHVARPKPTVAEVVVLVRGAGGVTSLAHPGIEKVSRHEVARFAAHGLDAVEAAHPNHPPNQCEAYARWAQAAGMRWTGGSDFHGPLAEDERFLLKTTPASELEALAELARRRGGVSL